MTKRKTKLLLKIDLIRERNGNKPYCVVTEKGRVQLHCSEDMEPYVTIAGVVKGWRERSRKGGHNGR